MPSPRSLLKDAATTLLWPRDATSVAVRVVFFALVHMAFGLAATATAVGETRLALVWPSAGVAAFWLFTGTRRSRPWDVAGLAVSATVAALGPTQGRAVLVVSWVVAALTMALLFRRLANRWTSLRRPDGTLRRLSSLSTVGSLAGAALVAAFAQVTIFELGLVLVGEQSWLSYLHPWGRNSIAVFTLVTTGLLLLGRIDPDPGDEVSDLSAARPRSAGIERRARDRVPEFAALVAFTVAVFVLTYGIFPELPMSFALFLPTAWVGIRFAPPTAAVHGLVVGAVAVGMTLADIGMYAQNDDAVVGALLSQAFLGVVFATSVVLSVIQTQLASAERAARSRTDVLDSVVQAVGDGVLLIEEGGRILLSNRAGHELLGEQDRPGYVGRLPPGEFFEPDGRPLTEERRFYARAFAGDEADGEDMVLRDTDGHEQVRRVSARLMDVPPGARRQVLLSWHDVTAERERNAVLASFAGEVAHDLKNPLAVVEGWSEMLAGELAASPTLDSAEGLGMIQRVQGAARQMRTLITELLTYTLARDQELHPERFSLRELAEAVAEQNREPSAESGREAARIVVDCDHDVWADRVLVGQLLDNLVGNAVKYVAKGVRPQVRISARTVDESVEVSISDNGMGVPEEARDQIFESFFRLDRPGYSGTGLELAICAKIVARHGSHLVVTDGPDGTGSTFTFRLPAPAA